MTFPLPYVVTVSDGVSIRTLHPPNLGRFRPGIEAALVELLELGGAPVPAPAPRPAPPPPEDRAGAARSQGYTGDSCDMCGSWSMRRTGTCLSCDSCGTTSGCG